MRTIRLKQKNRYLHGNTGKRYKVGLRDKPRLDSKDWRMDEVRFVFQKLGMLDATFKWNRNGCKNQYVSWVLPIDIFIEEIAFVKEARK